MNLVAWEEHFPEEVIPSSSVKFWSQVKKHERGGEKVFEKLADYALAVFTHPMSTTSVERVFSQVTFVKDKFSSRMGLPMLDLILTLKSYLQVRDKCCKDLIVASSMLSKMMADMYNEGEMDVDTETVFRNEYKIIILWIDNFFYSILLSSSLNIQGCIFLVRPLLFSPPSTLYFLPRDG